MQSGQLEIVWWEYVVRIISLVLEAMTVLWYAMLCYAMLYCAVLCHAMLCNAMLYYAVLCYAMLYYAVLCYAMLCYAVLCCTMLCYAMLCYAMLCNAVHVALKPKKDLVGKKCNPPRTNTNFLQALHRPLGGPKPCNCRHKRSRAPKMQY